MEIVWRLIICHCFIRTKENAEWACDNCAAGLGHQTRWFLVTAINDALQIKIKSKLDFWCLSARFKSVSVDLIFRLKKLIVVFQFQCSFICCSIIIEQPLIKSKTYEHKKCLLYMNEQTFSIVENSGSPLSHFSINSIDRLISLNYQWHSNWFWKSFYSSWIAAKIMVPFWWCYSKLKKLILNR